jgi:hypothetical protein
MVMQKVDEPSEDIRLKARLESANKKVFDLIQEAQKSNNPKTVYENLKVIDTDIDVWSETAMKIKDRETRKELMEKVSECKVRVI